MAESLEQENERLRQRIATLEAELGREAEQRKALHRLEGQLLEASVVAHDEQCEANHPKPPCYCWVRRKQELVRRREALDEKLPCGHPAACAETFIPGDMSETIYCAWCASLQAERERVREACIQAAQVVSERGLVEAPYSGAIWAEWAADKIRSLDITPKEVKHG